MHTVYGSREYWQAIANIAEGSGPGGLGDRIYVGIRVRVDGGRKHKGREGKVVRHMQSRYGSGTRYLTGASLDLHLMMGRDGFVALVQPDDTGTPEQFWVPCEHLTRVQDTCPARDDQ